MKVIAVYKTVSGGDEPRLEAIIARDERFTVEQQVEMFAIERRRIGQSWVIVPYTGEVMTVLEQDPDAISQMVQQKIDEERAYRERTARAWTHCRNCHVEIRPGRKLCPRCKEEFQRWGALLRMDLVR